MTWSSLIEPPKVVTEAKSRDTGSDKNPTHYKKNG
jgi:hypothetical protein